MEKAIGESCDYGYRRHHVPTEYQHEFLIKCSALSFRDTDCGKGGVRMVGMAFFFFFLSGLTVGGDELKQRKHEKVVREKRRENGKN